MKFLIGLLAMLLPIISGAQAPPVRALSIGDTVPDITITNVYNYPTSTIKLSDLKGKLVILDFWATWCTSCIANFPHADSLQQEFNNEVQIFLVNSKNTGDNTAKTVSFFEKRKIRTGLVNSLPVISEDSILQEYFPHRAIPHYVWIDKAGRFIAATSPIEVNSSNIKSILAGNNLSAPLKVDMKNFNRRKPVFWSGNGKAADNLIYRSLVTGYTEGLSGAGRRVNENNITTGVYYFNTSLLNLYKRAFSNITSDFFINNRTILEVRNPAVFQNISYNDASKYSGTYCYDLTIQPSTEDEVFNYMQEDLKRIFKVIAVTEKRTIKCIILKASSNVHKAYSKPGSSKALDLEKETLNKFIHNSPLSFIIQRLNSYSPNPIIDESDVKADISISLPYDLSDKKALIKSLVDAGFNVREETRVIDVVVLKDI